MEINLDKKQIAEIKQLVFSVVIDSIKQIEQPKPYLNRKDIAKYFGVSESTIRHWASLGMPVANIDGRKMYGKKSITDWIRSYEKPEQTKKPVTIGVVTSNTNKTKHGKI